MVGPVRVYDMVELVKYVKQFDLFAHVGNFIVTKHGQLMARKNRPKTEDGRYLVARGVLKRCTNPQLDDTLRRKALKTMMQARMSGDRAAVIAAKTVLGEAGPVWWDDGEQDCSGLEPMQTIYAEWWASLTDLERERRECLIGQ